MAEVPVERVTILKTSREYPFNSGGRPVLCPNGEMIIIALRGDLAKEPTYSGLETVLLRSKDKGKTWGDPVRLEGWEDPYAWLGENGVIVKGNTIFRFLLKWHNLSDSELYLKKSTDNGHTWSNGEHIDLGLAYIDSVGQSGLLLRDGTLLHCFSYDASPPVGAWRCTLIRSLDDGKTWSQGGVVPLGGATSLDEPSIVELKDGRILMFMRTNDGYLFKSYSEDEGLTWTPAVSTGLVSPSAPCCLYRLSWEPSKLIIAWNKSPTNRYPLVLRYSYDEGETWVDERVVDNTPRDVAYPSVSILGDGWILTYYRYNPDTYHRDGLGVIFYEERLPAVIPTAITIGVSPTSGYVPLSVTMSGVVTRTDTGEGVEPTMEVRLYRDGVYLQSVVTDAGGTYSFADTIRVEALTHIKQSSQRRVVTS